MLFPQLQVDTHVHHSASMNQKHLLRFIKSKMKRSPNELVCHRDGQALTLSEVFESLGFSAYELSIDTMDMHVSHARFVATASMIVLTCSGPIDRPTATTTGSTSST